MLVQEIESFSPGFWQIWGVTAPVVAALGTQLLSNYFERKRAQDEREFRVKQWKREATREDEQKEQQRQEEEAARLREKMYEHYPRFLSLASEVRAKVQLAGEHWREIPEREATVEQLSEAYHQVLMVASNSTASHAVEIFDRTLELIHEDSPPSDEGEILKIRAKFVREGRDDISDPAERVLHPKRRRTVSAGQRPFSLNRA